MNTKFSKPQNSAGFSLIELMLAMLIGLIVLGGVMQLYSSTRDTQRSSEDQLAMLGDARFAIETIAYDLRHTNFWGRHNNGGLVACQKAGADSLTCPSGITIPAATSDCAALEYANIARPLFASDGSNPYSATCASESYKTGTDVLAVRYADSNKVATGSLLNNVMYIRTSLAGGALFKSTGGALPSVTTSLPGWNDDNKSSNHRLVSRVYYVSDFTDAVGDGLPSLRRSELTAGPAMVSDVLLAGVEDFQLEFGIDIGSNGALGDRDGQIDSYVKASSVGDWALDVVAVRVWLLMRAEREDRDGIGAAQTFTIAGNTVTTANDGYRRYLVSSVVKLRNTYQSNVQ